MLNMYRIFCFQFENKGSNEVYKWFFNNAVFISVLRSFIVRMPGTNENAYFAAQIYAYMNIRRFLEMLWLIVFPATL